MPETSFLLKYNFSDIVRGVLIYSIGDTIASLILNQFSVERMLGIMLIGGTVYAFEIPNYFAWIDRKIKRNEDLISFAKRTALALLYFNPIWIARYLLFIKLFSNPKEINFELLQLGTYSFLFNLPFSIPINYLIQNTLKYNWRFFASAIFSSVMAIYYALSEVLFK